MINSRPSKLLLALRWLVLSFIVFFLSFQVLAQENNGTYASQSGSGNETNVAEADLNNSEGSLSNTVSTLLSLEEKIVQFFNLTVNEFGNICSAISEEISKIEGEGLNEKWAWIKQRYQTDRVGRVQWLMIFALFGASLLFLLFAIYGLLTRKKKKKQPSQITSVTPSEIRKQLNLDPPAASSSSKTFIQQLKAGLLDDVEKTLQLELAKSPGNEVLLMYLFACRAVRLNVQAYNDMIQQVLPTGLDSSQELCAHIAQIGRILAPNQFPLERYPDPKQTFHPDTKSISKSIEAISELGDVQTLLDLVRINTAKGEFSESKHLIVEALVRGNGKQRQHALEFARSIQI